MNTYILTFSCPDKEGIIAEVSHFLRERRFFIERLSEFGDPDTQKFFLRAVFRGKEPFPQEEFQKVAQKAQAKTHITPLSSRPKVLLLASKESHCLNDILHRWHTESLPIDVRGVVSNHELLKELTSWYKVPYHFFPVTKEDKKEDKILSLIAKEKIDLVIMARYMQILSKEFTEKMEGKVINIHHSFLPGFKGARPYHQAYERGVKIIGATAHYATENLDEGPIIEQETICVDHTHSPKDLSKMGRDIECRVLARAVLFHSENRVFINGNKTVIFK